MQRQAVAIVTNFIALRNEFFVVVVVEGNKHPYVVQPNILLNITTQSMHELQFLQHNDV
jgi:hypothetical protein